MQYVRLCQEIYKNLNGELQPCSTHDQAGSICVLTVVVGIVVASLPPLLGPPPLPPLPIPPLPPLWPPLPLPRPLSPASPLGISPLRVFGFGIIFGDAASRVSGALLTSLLPFPLSTPGTALAPGCASPSLLSFAFAFPLGALGFPRPLPFPLALMSLLVASSSSITRLLSNSHHS